MFFKKSEEIKKVNELNKPHKGDKTSKFSSYKNIIEIKGVKKTYVNGNMLHEVLKGVDLVIKKGEFVVILGPSGSGKTTLMNIISGLDRATEGEVNVADSNLINLTDDELTIFRRKNIAYVFQQYGLLPNLRVSENIAVGEYLSKNNQKEVYKKIKKITSHEVQKVFYLNIVKKINFYSYDYMFGFFLDNDIPFNKDLIPEPLQAFITNCFEVDFGKENYISVEEAMEMFNISSLANKYPSQLSGGQQQRVSIARAICKHAQILFADEPTGAVDEEMSNIILDAFKLINQRFKTTIIIVTHNPAIADLATKVIHFKNGFINKIIEQDLSNGLNANGTIENDTIELKSAS